MTAYYTGPEEKWLLKRATQEQNATVPESVDSRGNIVWGTDFKQHADTSPSEYVAPEGGDCA